MATIQQIAELAGVSRGTVDRALNGRGRVSPVAEEKIKRIAKELGYVPKHRKPAPVSPEDKKTIGVVTQLSGSSFMIEVDRGIAEAKRVLGEKGVAVIVRECQSVDEEEQIRAIDSLMESGIDALAIMPVESNMVREKLNGLIEEKGIPVVTFNSDIVGTKRSCYVGLDNRKSGQTAAALMGLMTREYGKILIITGYFTNSVSSQRVDGFIETMKQDFPGMELAGVQTSFDKAKEVENIIINSMHTFPDLSGIFVASGGQAGVGSAFEKLGIEKRPYVIIYDLTSKNEQALKERTVDFLIDQEGYEQGYRPPVLLAERLLKGLEIEKECMYTEISIKNRYNL